MKTTLFLQSMFAVLAAVILPLPALAQESNTKGLDYGDYSPSTLRMKASAAFDNGDYRVALIYANKCITLFSKDALAQQAALTEMPTDKDVVFKQWALNDVGVAYLLKGQALEGQDNKIGALEAYQFLIEKLPYAQCWDPAGWFWSPVELAKERVASLSN